MSAGAVAELEALLSGMAAGRAPGVSGNKITAIMHLCLQNVEFESVLIQKIYTHFKKTPGTHKLGVLYVVDSVTRKWLDHAKSQNQVISNGAIDGTYAAGVNRVTGLIPGLMSDIISTAPVEQKEKIEKLIGIWERVQLFPPDMLEEFRHQLSNMGNNKIPSHPGKSTTPPGSPPRNVGLPGHPASSATAAPSGPGPTQASDILKRLAQMAHNPPPPTTTTAAVLPAQTHVQSPPLPQPPAAFAQQQQPQSLLNILGTLRGTNSQSAPTGQNGKGDGSYGRGYQQPLATQPANHAPPPPVGYAATTAPPPGNVHATVNPYMAQPPISSAPSGGYMKPQQAPASATVNYAQPDFTSPLDLQNLDPATRQQVVFITQLAKQGLSGDDIKRVIEAYPGGMPFGGPPAGPPPPPAHQYGAPQEYNAQYESRDRDRGYHDSLRSPGGYRPRGRSRSRSPGRNWPSQGSPFSPRAGDIGGHFGDFGAYQDRGYNNGRREYRQRSPQRRDRSPSPPGRYGAPTGMGYQSMEIPPAEDVPKFIDYDTNLGSNKIKVLSRTLFVGGVSCSEDELKQVFSKYGYVQSCIVNQDKRHAFVKMMTRKHAVAAREAMEEKSIGRDGLAQEGLPFRQCRWGVGYGPRDCSDYSTGISIIPIDRLTEADRRWMLTAPYGGSGGKEITPGLVVEEPDIEIGAGVSSKAISRRVGGEKGTHKKGGKFERRGKSDDHDGSRGGWGHNNNRDKDSSHHGRGSGSRDMGNPNNMPIAERRPGGGGHNTNNGQPDEIPQVSFDATGQFQFPPGFQLQ
ncbi:Rpb7-binding protein seb1 [Zalerion maritima]|uniref:Rpb7-binding protein seb1 n=1 Tax=Zalerion maritima TaxID=339359 RepID=A0AAD5RRH0_9PEZI|nr:Rpb7-binding protein seb1 [Zalerion maritima]